MLVFDLTTLNLGETSCIIGYIEMCDQYRIVDCTTKAGKRLVGLHAAEGLTVSHVPVYIIKSDVSSLKMYCARRVLNQRVSVLATRITSSDRARVRAEIFPNIIT
jgi:hypothetical protein